MGRKRGEKWEGRTSEWKEEVQYNRKRGKVIEEEGKGKRTKGQEIQTGTKIEVWRETRWRDRDRR